MPKFQKRIRLLYSAKIILRVNSLKKHTYFIYLCIIIIINLSYTPAKIYGFITPFNLRQFSLLDFSSWISDCVDLKFLIPKLKSGVGAMEQRSTPLE